MFNILDHGWWCLWFKVPVIILGFLQVILYILKFINWLIRKYK